MINLYLSVPLTKSQAIGHGCAARIISHWALRLQEAVVKQVTSFLYGEGSTPALRHAILVHHTASEDQTPSDDQKVI